MPVGATVTRNGKAYDGGDVRCDIDGSEYFGVSDISYGNDEANQLNYSGKKRPTSWSSGKVTPYASMTMDLADVFALEQKYGSLIKVKPFYITIVFGDEFNVTITDRILVKFSKEGREVSEAMNLKMQFPLFALTVELNV